MHSVLFEIGSFQIPSYGVMIALGMVAATTLAYRMARRRGLSGDYVLDAVFWAVLAGFIGARLAYLATTRREALSDPIASIFGGGGGIYLAGLAAGLGATIWQARRHHIGIPTAFDLLAPALAVAHAFGRVGCFLAGCCYGSPLSHGGVCYPPASWPYMDQLANGLISSAAATTLPIHAVQLYEAIGNAILAGGLYLFWKRSPAAGSVAAAYAVAYALMRFALEFFRGDAIRGQWGGLSTSQWLSLALAIAGLAAWHQIRRRA
ncbi:hypothetical protein CVU37_12330 [candidate division BRC1 bacterium HGW-BRC1-1]|nr:MAG: hypothetical protein CVU37_12330 [candidate division BRC1 bacterium HGW-BRC1-1]